MKIERVFVLRFDDGQRIPYGVPEFLSEDEAADFLAHVQGELGEGAATYFATCCQGAGQGADADHAGDDDDDDDDAEPERGLGRGREISFVDDPSERVRRLEFIANNLRKLGLKIFASRMRQVEVIAQQERQRQLEQELDVEPAPQISKGISR